MTIFYRLAHAKSPLSNPTPVFEDDQFKLNEMCLKSVLLAYGDIKPKMVFICDFCPKDLYGPLLDKVPFEKEIHWTDKGINETCLFQYEMAKEVEDDTILFQECDYLYRPLVGKKMENAIKTFGLVSPYDNLNFYLDKSLHSEDTKIKLLDDQHYRTVERNTMTFGLTKKNFVDNYEIFKKWGYLDGEVWLELKAQGLDLHVPIPSFSTHMAKDFIAPALDWQKLINLYAKS